MMDADSIRAIQEAQTVSQVQEALNTACLATPITATPNNFDLHSLEKYLPGRVRERGAFATHSIADFVEYCTHKAVPGTTCFVSPEKMGAVTIFNLGTAVEPGHGDDVAGLDLQSTPEFDFLTKTLNAGRRFTQRELAEVLEEWGDNMTCYASYEAVNGSNASTLGQAIAAVRKVTVEARREGSSSEGHLRTERSLSESVEIKADHLPVWISFTCIPFLGLEERTFWLRVSEITNGDSLQFAPRAVKLEVQMEEMRKELLALLKSRFLDTSEIELFTGNYQVGK